jgi:hypothetical protein
MRFVLTETHWILDSLFPGEWEWVSELPKVAAGEGFRPESLERLRPSPLAPDELADEGTLEQMEDWDELIRPELEAQFSEARSLVEADLSRCEVMPGPDEEIDDLRDQMEESGFLFDLPALRRLAVPIEHTEAWCSTLNQARLLLHEEYGLADSEERALVKMLGPEAVGPERLLLMARYELYSVVQSILVENLMDG